MAVSLGELTPGLEADIAEARRVPGAVAAWKAARPVGSGAKVLVSVARPAMKIFKVLVPLRPGRPVRRGSR
jgi:hypothetical protein